MQLLYLDRRPRTRVVVLVLEYSPDHAVHLQVAVDVEHSRSVDERVHDVNLVQKALQLQPRSLDLLQPVQLGRALLHPSSNWRQRRRVARRS